jgi:hypothetical protein
MKLRKQTIGTMRRQTIGKNHRNLTLLGAAAIVVFAAGTFGFQRHYAELAGPGRTPFGESLYAALRLFSIDFDGDRDRMKPWILEAARWLAPLVFATGLFQLLLEVFRERYELIKIRRAKGHYILCGDSAMIDVLARDLLENGQTVVLVREDPERFEVAELQRNGAMHLSVNPESAGILLIAGLERAKGLVVAMREDRTNVAVAMSALRHCLGNGISLEALIHVDDTQFRDLLQRNEILIGDASVRVGVFSQCQIIARLFWEETPFELIPKENQLAESVHLVLPSFRNIGAALALQAARLGHYSNLEPITLHLLSTDSGAEVAGLLHRYPALDKCCRISEHRLDSEWEFANRAIHLVKALGTTSSVSIFTSFESPADGMQQAILFAESLPSLYHPRVVLHGDYEVEIQKLRHQFPHVQFDLLPGADVALGMDTVIGGELDRQARMIHEEWLAMEKENMEKDPKRPQKPAFRDWGALTENQKDGNRSQAEHIAIKIRAAGLCRDTAKQEWARITLDSALVETLAEMEHNRWCADKWLNGWTYSESRNDEAKQHNNLTSYDALSEREKDYDRDTVTKLIKYL